jgi:hypothetical protein
MNSRNIGENFYIRNIGKQGTLGKFDSRWVQTSCRLCVAVSSRRSCIEAAILSISRPNPSRGEKLLHYKYSWYKYSRIESLRCSPITSPERLVGIGEKHRAYESAPHVGDYLEPYFGITLTSKF